MDNSQKRFLATFSALLAKMAMADGTVTPAEIKSIDGIWERIGLTAEQREYAGLAFRGALTDGIPLERYATEFVNTKIGFEARSFLYDLLWEVACADGILHQNEKRALAALPNLFGLPLFSFDECLARFITTGKRAVDAEVEELRRKHVEEEFKRRMHAKEARRRAAIHIPRTLGESYEILGCSVSDSDEAIKKSFRTLVKKWHPDILRAQGVPEEMVLVANDKTAAYNSAWDLIRRARGIKGTC